MNSGLPDDVSDYNLLNDSDGELAFVLEVAYLTSQLLSEDQLAFHLELHLGLHMVNASQSARDAVDAFSQY